MINLINGKGYRKVRGINKMVRRESLFPSFSCYISILRKEEIDEKELEKINR